MILGIIPARYASTRFPGKPLIEIEGVSMIRRVYEQARKAVALGALHEVAVATDDERIMDHVASFGGRVVMTSENHPSGTDRCWEALQNMGGQYQYVINIQGDEPVINPNQIKDLAVALDGNVELATQMTPITSGGDLFDAGTVKIALNAAGEALYFSRSPIPFLRNIPQDQWHEKHRYYRHIGMYAYRVDVLERLVKLPVSPLEKAESLEQLRWLEAGFRIKCLSTSYESHSIDTPADLEKVLQLIRNTPLV